VKTVWEIINVIVGSSESKIKRLKKMDLDTFAEGTID